MLLQSFCLNFYVLRILLQMKRHKSAWTISHSIIVALAQRVHSGSIDHCCVACSLADFRGVARRSFLPFPS